MGSASLTVSFEVRDYECDLQGIVNNAVYQHYLEHARHLFLKSKGLSFAALSRQGINLVVVRAEIDYKAPLTSGEHFRVTSKLERLSPVRFVFVQAIQRTPDQKVILQANIVCAAMDRRGKPIISRSIDALFR